jgi:hypothetical protein
MIEVRNEVDWQVLINRIKDDSCMPIISYHVSNNLMSDHESVIEKWAESVGYRLTDRRNLTRIAQYVNVTRRDEFAAQVKYLDYLKKYLLDQAKSTTSVDLRFFLDLLEDELSELPFSRVARRLDYPNFADEPDDSLRILAGFPFSIYLTTNYSTFMEEALRTEGREPRTEMSYWREDLKDKVPSVFETDPNYRPSVDEPLVYHLYGLDTYAPSLVLTEDNYLDFLVKVSHVPEVIDKVRTALASKSLLLLGYQLDGWDFRVLFRGLITSKNDPRRSLCLSIQVKPDEEGIIDYLLEYFKDAHFEIYWGDAA